ncbi:uncharacterized protein F4807DRAFT_206327 [Annulohypoxylon truncatum]|uniref:uncharacterized protein n=1 Tax=Annulohypoxylon truncatum TaxID=327061 RepID=UPI002007784F|nr:uncharacterized protein F4807DRAFT_206327 [Annulohypoxylon truncatum]KAI1213942.1 hypothetical protein F4807DRAFT_206327 [Annulohypoxylon truncatum]
MLIGPKYAGEEAKTSKELTRSSRITPGTVPYRAPGSSLNRICRSFRASSQVRGRRGSPRCCIITWGGHFVLKGFPGRLSSYYFANLGEQVGGNGAVPILVLVAELSIPPTGAEGGSFSKRTVVQSRASMLSRYAHIWENRILRSNHEIDNDVVDNESRVSLSVTWRQIAETTEQ